MEENKEIIDDGKFFTFAYTVKDADTGELLFEAKKSAPDSMVYGLTNQAIAGPDIVATLKGMGAGDRFSVTLPPEVAFGQRKEEWIQQIPVEAFMRDGKMAVEVKEGSVLDMMTADGDIVSGRVIKVTPETIEMDFNHPFAGKTVDFEGEILEVRDATEDELNPKQGCGCGCGHHGGCDDSCGCSKEGDNDACGCGSGCNCH